MGKSLTKEGLIKKLRKGHWTLQQLGATRKQMRELRDEGHKVQCQRINDVRVYYITTDMETASHFISGASDKPTSVKWLEISDIHAGSKFFLEEDLRFVLKRAQDDGFTEVHISGDLTDGIGIYKGHLNNLRYITAEDQAACLAEVLSDFPTLHFYAITGNHDYSWEQQGSVNPLTLVQNDLGNFTFLNSFSAALIIGGVAKVMTHGRGGRTYSKSYPIQTYIRELLDGDEFIVVSGHKYRIRFLQLGHFHSNILLRSAGIVCTTPASFQSPMNDYCQRAGLTGENGGRLVESVIHHGEVVSHKSEFVKLWK